MKKLRMIWEFEEYARGKNPGDMLGKERRIKCTRYSRTSKLSVYIHFNSQILKYICRRDYSVIPFYFLILHLISVSLAIYT